MPSIIISVTNKVATLRAPATIVCGNSDYTVSFTFDSEWNDYDAKTLEVKYYNKEGVLSKKEVLFSGDSVDVPILHDVSEVEIGVYAGNLHTSTGARVACARSITDGDPVHDPPTPDVYDQLLELLAHAGMTAGVVGATALAAHGEMYDIIGIAETED